MQIFPSTISGVGLFCLSNYPDEERYSIGCERLRAAGVDIEPPPSPIPRFRQFAGDDKCRADGFNRAVASPHTQLLMAVRGGSGAARALSRIDFASLRVSGKIVCGYSDTTALLLAAAANGCTRLLHGPMVCSSWTLEADALEFIREMESFAGVLAGSAQLLPDWARDGLQVLRPGNVSGRLYAANLTLLQTLIGTPYLPELDGAILICEDVNAPAHDIDRKLNHLRQAGILERLGGLAFGQFTDAEDAEYLPEIMADYAQRVNGPVVANFPVGHNHPSLTIPCALPAEFRVDDGGVWLQLL